MTLTAQDCEKAIAGMSATEQLRFLVRLGQKLTIVAREVYEFQGPGVTNSRWLRDLNEIHHRIYPQIRGLVEQNEPTFHPKSLTSWLTAESQSPELRAACLRAIERTLQRIGRST